MTHHSKPQEEITTNAFPPKDSPKWAIVNPNMNDNTLNAVKYRSMSPSFPMGESYRRRMRDELVKLKAINIPAEIISSKCVNGTKAATIVIKIPDMTVPCHMFPLSSTLAKILGIKLGQEKRILFSKGKGDSLH